MSLEALSAYGRDADRWQEAIERLAIPADVHFMPQYAAVQEILGLDARLLAWRGAAAQFVQPVLIRRSPVGTVTAIDMESPYGFGGPIDGQGSIDPARSYIGFAADIADWAKSLGIVTERCVLHPFMSDRQTYILNRSATATFSKPVVYLPLKTDFVALYHANRKAGIKVANRCGVTVEHVEPSPENVATFVRLYNATMQRRRAHARWCLPAEYFEAHFLRMPASSSLFFAMIDGAVEVATIVVRSSTVAHYHFSASEHRHPKSGANDLMIDAIARWAHRMGCDRLHLGGGVTAASDDRLLAYKASFGDCRAPVLTYRRIFDERRYDTLCVEAARLEADGLCAPVAAGFFPPYRRAS